MNGNSSDEKLPLKKEKAGCLMGRSGLWNHGVYIAFFKYIAFQGSWLPYIICMISSVEEELLRECHSVPMIFCTVARPTIYSDEKGKNTLKARVL